MIIKTSTFPHGPASYQEGDTVVQRILSNGRFLDTYIHELVKGDEYFIPKPIVSDFLSIIESMNLEIAYEYDVDGKAVSGVVRNEHSLDLYVQEHLYDGWLKDALLYINDMETSEATK